MAATRWRAGPTHAGPDRKSLCRIGRSGEKRERLRLRRCCVSAPHGAARHGPRCQGRRRTCSLGCVYQSRGNAVGYCRRPLGSWQLLQKAVAGTGTEANITLTAASTSAELGCQFRHGLHALQRLKCRLRLQLGGVLPSFR